MTRSERAYIWNLVGRTVTEHATRAADLHATEVAADVAKHPALRYIRVSPDQILEMVRENFRKRWGS